MRRDSRKSHGERFIVEGDGEPRNCATQIFFFFHFRILRHFSFFASLAHAKAVTAIHRNSSCCRRLHLLIMSTRPRGRTLTSGWPY